MTQNKLPHSFFRRFFGHKSKKSTASTLSELANILAQPDNPDLGADEEERIFKDHSTGKFHTKIVKKANATVPEQTPETPPYPPSRKVSFTETDHIVVLHDEKPYQLRVHYHANEPEEDDILQSRDGDLHHLVHPAAIFRQVVSTPGTFLADMAEETLSELESLPCLRIQFMDESREYYDLTIGTMRVSVPGKYLGLTFYLIPQGDQLVVATEHLVDENADELPIVVTSLETECVSHTSAVFDQDDQLWYWRDA
jgi:hypothetical protein